MILSYAELLSPLPFKLSIGSIKKPKLLDIFRISYEVFTLYEFFLRMTPDDYFKKFNIEKLPMWESLSKEDKDKISLIDLVVRDTKLYAIYQELLDFFFEESIEQSEDGFAVFKMEGEEKVICGGINKSNFDELLEVIQQICNIYDNPADKTQEEKPKFKNKLAERLWMQMEEERLKQEKVKNAKRLIHYQIPNLISAICAKHESLNYTNIWDLTIFQLQDTFNRLQRNVFFDISTHSVSVWGDEKKTFDESAWFNNYFEEK